MTESLLLLPGLLCDAASWAPQVAAFAPGRPTQVADYGDADRITAMAEAALAAAPARFALAGHSMGARVALEVWRLAPERVARIALLDTGVHPVREGEAAKRHALRDLGYAKGMAAVTGAWLPPMVHPDRRGDAALMEPLRAMVQRFSPRRFEGQLEALLNRPEAEAVLDTVTCPVLIGGGRQDAWSPPAQHEAMATRLPHARLVVFEDCGHMAPVERPEAVTAALERWLEA
jgi:pimeloyl-ACP methyl ester carboxylesterase